MKFILILMMLISCSNYYKGEISDHFDGNKFYDSESNYQQNLWSLLRWQISKKSTKWPDYIELNKYDQPPERVYGDELRVFNVGHMTFLIQTQGLNILTDPI